MVKEIKYLSQDIKIANRISYSQSFLADFFHDFGTLTIEGSIHSWTCVTKIHLHVI